MGIFDIFGKRVSIDEGVAQFNETPHAILLDVRTPQEHNRGHIPQSINLPLDRLSKIAYSKTVPLFVYCQSGARSGQACAWLGQQGYQQVTNIGGLSAYRGPLK